MPRFYEKGISTSQINKYLRQFQGTDTSKYRVYTKTGRVQQSFSTILETTGSIPRLLTWKAVNDRLVNENMPKMTMKMYKEMRDELLEEFEASGRTTVEGNINYYNEFSKRSIETIIGNIPMSTAEREKIVDMLIEYEKSEGELMVDAYQKFKEWRRENAVNADVSFNSIKYTKKMLDFIGEVLVDNGMAQFDEYGNIKYGELYNESE